MVIQIYVIYHSNLVLFKDREFSLKGKHDPFLCIYLYMKNKEFEGKLIIFSKCDELILKYVKTCDSIHLHKVIYHYFLGVLN